MVEEYEDSDGHDIESMSSNSPDVTHHANDYAATSTQSVAQHQLLPFSEKYYNGNLQMQMYPRDSVDSMESQLDHQVAIRGKPVDVVCSQSHHPVCSSYFCYCDCLIRSLFIIPIATPTVPKPTATLSTAETTRPPLIHYHHG